MPHEMEREAKFRLPAGTAMPLLDVATTQLISQVRLRATYWDTPEHRLLAYGHTLRHRSATDDSEGGWTLKLSPGIGAADDTDPADRHGLIARREVDVEGSPEAVPDTVRDLVAGAVRSEALAPVATIVTDRRRVVLTAPDGRPMVEVADDAVMATPTGGSEMVFREIEVERLDAAGTDIVGELIDRMIAAGARRVHRSKLHVALAADPRTAPHRLAKKATVRDLVGTAISAGTDRLLSNDPNVRLGDSAAVHQARVATRRLRSDLRSLRAVLDGERVEHLRGELAWLADLLGGVRDDDVLRLRLRDDDAGCDLGPQSADGLVEVLAALDRDRQSHQAELGAALTSVRYLDLLDQLTTAADAPPFANGVDPDARAAGLAAHVTQVAWRRTAKAVKALDSHPGSAELHDIRKRAKRARYAGELAALVHGRRAQRFAARMATVQDDLGTQHDAVVAEQWLREAVERHGLSGAGGFAAGQLAERERARAAAAADGWRAAWHTAAKPSRRSWFEV